MSFELYYPTRVVVGMGQASLDAAGNLTLNAVDPQTLGIRDTAAILIDRGLKRLAIKAPKSTDPAKRLAFNKSHNAAKLNVKGALASMGIKLSPRKLAAVSKDNLLIINLA